jgi:hypothetical protein
MTDRQKDMIRFIAGLLAFGYEVIIENSDRPWIIVTAAGLMGYSAVTNLAGRLK